MNAHHGEHIVDSHRLLVLIRDLRIPGDLAPALVGAQALARTGQAHLDPVAGLQRFDETSSSRGFLRALTPALWIGDEGCEGYAPEADCIEGTSVRHRP